MSASTLRVTQTCLASQRGYRITGAKSGIRLGIGNSGLPKGRNSHGDGCAIVGLNAPGKPSLTRGIHTKVRKLDNSSKPEARVGRGSLEEMLVFDDRGRCTNALKVIKDKTVLMTAYNNIKSKPGNMTPGTDKITLDGIEEKWFEETSNSLGLGKYKFNPTRRVYIPKANGKMRPLGVGSPRDKIIQEAMRAVLEAVLESKFKDSSHGFRPERGCHTALAQIRY
jgi:retron-type reverse transcriptase